MGKRTKADKVRRLGTTSLIFSIMSLMMAITLALVGFGGNTSNEGALVAMIIAFVCLFLGMAVLLTALITGIFSLIFAIKNKYKFRVQIISLSLSFVTLIMIILGVLA